MRRCLTTRCGRIRDTARNPARVSLIYCVEDPSVTGAWPAEAFMPNIPELLMN